ncbi:MAG: alpha/beta fold hydrolase [Candidatus Bipolaricaulota bacterium]|nr:alpha/beta fold hydrolase [Candidatus Bipolaricaulota bacterium]
MSYAINGNVHIHYEVEGKGPALVLHHWTFSSLDAWYELGYADALAPERRLILIDSRGHGESDAPHGEGAYRPEPRVADVVTVLDALEIPVAAFFGYSMGGWICFACAKWAPERFSAFLLGGQHPYAQTMSGAREWLRVGEEEGAGAFIDLWEREVGPLRPAERERMRSFDFTAMRAAAQDRGSLEPTLPEIRVPCLLFAGANDEVHGLADRAAAQIHSARFVSLPDLNHAEVMARSDLVAPMVRGFLHHAAV